MSQFHEINVTEKHRQTDGPKNRMTERQLGGQTDQNPENLFTKLGSNISSFINSVADENLVEKLNKYRQFTKLLMIRNSYEVMRR